MSFSGVPLERGHLDVIRARFPGFKGELPEGAKYWTQADVERFQRSGGAARPAETAQRQAPPACALLTRARVKLAGERISEATAEYRSLCRHLREARDPWRLSTVTECAEVPRARVVPKRFRTAVVVEKQREWRARLWNMDFWKRECGGEGWLCQSRSPRFQDDAEGADSFDIESSIEEYVDYARLVHRLDRKCAEENSLAYPRVSLDGWPAFSGTLLPRFAGCWQELGPPGLKDLTGRWVEAFSRVVNLDWLEALARFYHVSIRPTGAVTRLHTESHGAHLWINQVEGRTVFFLFSPQEAQNLYGSCATGESPVDIFFPSAKRHPRFHEARAQVAVLYLGQTLVIPAAWWWYSAALEPSVTLSHPFWDMENRMHFSESLKARFEMSAPGPQGLRQKLAASLAAVHDHIMADEDSEVED